MKSPAKSILGRRYDYRPPPASNKLMLSAPHPQRLGLPEKPSVDLRNLCTPVRDQGQKGSCFAFAASGFKEVTASIWGGRKAPLGAHLAPDFLYYWARVWEGSYPQDRGASMADAMKELHERGCPPESFMPYDPSDAGVMPSPAADVAAQPYQCGQPLLLEPSDAAGLRAFLSDHELPVAFGTTVYQSFERTGSDGIVPDVAPDEGVLGGHALLCLGYDAQHRWIVRNSWGAAWGDQGYCYMPESYVEHWLEAWSVSGS